ncbi:putative retrotransposon hot spot protein (RHS) [Trypanosoma cruzi]|uniref:Putative retrotransposon hot spot protein (RHS) n=1 Tax=Trypanosoma cruzi TaxID=5693 RepID=A0A2V2XNT3_TRYCR|nr:putative retrotransposon hot spot protein (RHS) [Trypanosoma cruzi]
MKQTDRQREKTEKGDSVAVLGGGWPRLLHRQVLQCGCMAHRPPSRASVTPNAIGTAGRNSRECALGPAAPAGRSWAVRVGCFTALVL